MGRQEGQELKVTLCYNSVEASVVLQAPVMVYGAHFFNILT